MMQCWTKYLSAANFDQGAQAQLYDLAETNFVGYRNAMIIVGKIAARIGDSRIEAKRLRNPSGFLMALVADAKIEMGYWNPRGS